MPSPLESMIDAACGFDRESYRREQAAIRGRDADNDWLILFCPGPRRDGHKCSEIMAVERADHDEPSATVLEIQCPECNGGDFDSPAYYDGNGRELPYV
jgi:hypothetical protein